MTFKGRWNAPYVKHFVVPSVPGPAVAGIASYEYWFNNGPRVRVAVDPGRVLTLGQPFDGVMLSENNTKNTAESFALCGFLFIFATNF